MAGSLYTRREILLICAADRISPIQVLSKGLKLPILQEPTGKVTKKTKCLPAFMALLFLLQKNWMNTLYCWKKQKKGITEIR